MKRKRDDEHVNEANDATSEPITCTHSSCQHNPPQFSSYPEFESHVQTCHTYICIECRKRFPSESLLSLHIEENHDVFFTVKRERGEKVYRCMNYINGCKKKCIDRKKRRLHMIDKHGYPREYKFAIIDTGI